MYVVLECQRSVWRETQATSAEPSQAAAAEQQQRITYSANSWINKKLEEETSRYTSD